MRLYHRTELLQRGWSSRRINLELRRGSLLRVARGLYTKNRTLSLQDRHLLLVRYYGQEVFGLETAALLHALPLERVPSKVQVLVPGAGRSREREDRSIHSGPLPPAALTSVRGFQVTSLARTLVDLARVRPVLEALVPWEAALWRARVEEGAGDLRDRIAAELDAAGTRRGVRQARWIHEFASPWSQSPKETASRLLLDQLGLPTPVQQFEVWQHGSKLGTTDFAWPELGVLGEYDGKGKYVAYDASLTPEEVMWREKRRQEAMEAAGWVFARWNHQHLLHPAQLKQRVEAAYDIAAGRRAA